MRACSTGMASTRAAPRCCLERACRLLPGSCLPGLLLHNARTATQWGVPFNAVHTADAQGLRQFLCFGRGKPPSIVHRVDVIGISCYTSTDLIHWHSEGALTQRFLRRQQPVPHQQSLFVCLRHPEEALHTWDKIPQQFQRDLLLI